jgi:hypothetical protein
MSRSRKYCAIVKIVPARGSGFGAGGRTVALRKRVGQLSLRHSTSLDAGELITPSLCNGKEREGQESGLRGTWINQDHRSGFSPEVAGRNAGSEPTSAAARINVSMPQSA